MTRVEYDTVAGERDAALRLWWVLFLRRGEIVCTRRITVQAVHECAGAESDRNPAFELVIREAIQEGIELVRVEEG